VALFKKAKLKNNIMQPFFHHYRTTLKKDLSSRFIYENPTQLPKLKKINLNIGVKESSLKNILPNFLGVEFITSKYPQLTQSNKNSVFFNLKKNSPNGVKVDLQGKQAYLFLQKLILQTIPNFKNRKDAFEISQSSSFSFSIRELDSFQELTLFYNFFKNIESLDITFQVTTRTPLELAFFLTSFKFPGSCVRK